MKAFALSGLLLLAGVATAGAQVRRPSPVPGTHYVVMDMVGSLNKPLNGNPPTLTGAFYDVATDQCKYDITVFTQTNQYDSFTIAPDAVQPTSCKHKLPTETYNQGGSSFGGAPYPFNVDSFDSCNKAAGGLVTSNGGQDVNQNYMYRITGMMELADVCW
jgi:hypothetical protein